MQKTETFTGTRKFSPYSKSGISFIQNRGKEGKLFMGCEKNLDDQEFTFLFLKIGNVKILTKVLIRYSPSPEEILLMKMEEGANGSVLVFTASDEGNSGTKFFFFQKEEGIE